MVDGLGTVMLTTPRIAYRGGYDLVYGDSYDGFRYVLGSDNF